MKYGPGISVPTNTKGAGWPSDPGDCHVHAAPSGVRLSAGLGRFENDHSAPGCFRTKMAVCRDRTSPSPVAPFGGWKSEAPMNTQLVSCQMRLANGGPKPRVPHFQHANGGPHR